MGDFAILLRKDTGIDVGEYWQDNPEELEEIAKKKGWKIEEGAFE